MLIWSSTFMSGKFLAALPYKILLNHFNDKVFKTIIPRNVRVSEAPSYGQPVLMYDISCPGSQAYASLAGEIINQEKDLK